MACALLGGLAGCPHPGSDPARDDGGVDVPDAAPPDGGDGDGDGDGDAGDTCKIRGQAAALSVVDRSIIGSPAATHPTSRCASAKTS